ncbi:MAG: hypothetical protein CM1200mP29_03810 [Verrucomicrobiota bacterium]|nr:MAG: hypothetical protein CM1200mP29_03810 [Verrucomicrobiota bacterium]
MVHGGPLFPCVKKEHTATAAEHGIRPIDLVVVNLYPFEQTVAKPDVTLEDAIENIDIGGPLMLRRQRKITRASPWWSIPRLQPGRRSGFLRR